MTTALLYGSVRDDPTKRFLDEYEWYLKAMKAQRALGLPI